MKIKGLIDEDFVNFKVPSMYIIFPQCSFKCDKENGTQICQNWSLAREADIEIDKEELINRYKQNTLTQAFVMAGLEPFDSEIDLIALIDSIRRAHHILDPIVIYTGYTEEELKNGNWGHGAPDSQKQYWNLLMSYPNIIIKFGRFQPNQPSHFDEVLGVNLASPNQYAKEFNYAREN